MISHNLGYFLGMEIIRYINRSIHLHQLNYTNKLICKFNLMDAKVLSTPIDRSHTNIILQRVIINFHTGKLKETVTNSNSQLPTKLIIFITSHKAGHSIRCKLY